MLLKKEYRKYNVVDDTHPDATRYKEALSGEGMNAGFRAKSIFIGQWSLFHVVICYLSPSPPQVTKSPIPQAVLDGWFSPSFAPVVPEICNTPPSTQVGSKRSRVGK